MKLAATLEQVATETYLSDLAQFRSKKAKAVMASVMGVESQHLAVLRAVGALLEGGGAAPHRDPDRRGGTSGRGGQLSPSPTHSKARRWRVLPRKVRSDERRDLRDERDQRTERAPHVHATGVQPARVPGGHGRHRRRRRRRQPPRRCRRRQHDRVGPSRPERCQQRRRHRRVRREPRGARGRHLQGCARRRAGREPRAGAARRRRVRDRRPWPSTRHSSTSGTRS